jgi:hypothetical protein
VAGGAVGGSHTQDTTLRSVAWLVRPPAQPIPHPPRPTPQHPTHTSTQHPNSFLASEIERLKAGELDGKLKEVAAYAIPPRFKRVLALPGLGLPPPLVLSETEEEEEEDGSEQEEGSEEEEEEEGSEGSEGEDEDEEDEEEEEPRRGRRQRKPSAKVRDIIYIYTYIERERKRARGGMMTVVWAGGSVYIYIHGG